VSPEPRDGFDLVEVAPWESADDKDDNPTWRPVDLAAVIAGGLEIDPPSLGRRSDDVCLLYSSAVHWIFGEPEAGKGWLVALSAVEVLEADGRVLIVDFESSAKENVGRLRALGVSDEMIVEAVTYLHPEPPARVDLLGALVIELNPVLAVVDGVNAAMAVLGLDPNTSPDVNAFYATMLRPMARSGAATVAIDHVVKAQENRGRWPTGNGAKLGLADVGLGVECVRPFGRNVKNGLSRVVLHKDRLGWLRQSCNGRTLAELELCSSDLAVIALLTPSTGAKTFRPTVLMERLSLAIEAAPGVTKNGLMAGVLGKTAAKRRALDLLESEGYIETKKGARRSVEHHSIRPFRVVDDELGEEPDDPPF
jgi:hypothetical protein